MLLFFVCAPLVIALLEVLFFGIKNSSVAVLCTFNKNALWDIFSYIVVLAGIDYLILNFYFLGYFNYFNNFLKAKSGYLLSLEPTLVNGLVVFVIFDFCIYWMHRLQHYSDWLWLTHKYHHASEELTVLSWIRTHPLHEIFKVKTAVGFILGFMVLKQYFFILRSLINILAHARLDTNYGFIGKYVFVSPRYHYQHHNRKNMNVNFSTGLVVWDRLFGTYQLSNTSIYDIDCGLDDKNYKLDSIWNIYAQPFIDFATYPFRRWFFHKK